MRRPCMTVCLCIVAAFWLWVTAVDARAPGAGAWPIPAGETVTITALADWKDSRYFYLDSIQILEAGSDSRQQIHYDNSKVQKLLAERDPGWDVPIGARIVLKGRYVPFDRATNPGEFDSFGYYRSRQIGGRLKDVVLLEQDGASDSVKEVLYRLREYFSARLYRVFPQKEASVLATMLLGDKSGLDSELKALYQRNGIVHILSISGLHISFLGVGIYELLRRLRLPRSVSAVVGGILLLLYGVMTGMSVSACRAIGMYLLRMGALLAGRTYDLPTAAGILCAVMTATNPWNLQNSGFWLSFASVFGIGLIEPLLPEASDWIGKSAPDASWRQRMLRGVAGKFWDSLMAGLSVTLATLPIQLLFYYEVPIFGMVLNLLILPLMGVVLGVGLFVMLLPGTGILGTVDCLILAYCEKLCEFFDRLPLHTWNPGCPRSWQVLLYAAVLAAVIWMGRGGKRGSGLDGKRGFALAGKWGFDAGGKRDSASAEKREIITVGKRGFVSAGKRGIFTVGKMDISLAGKWGFVAGGKQDSASSEKRDFITVGKRGFVSAGKRGIFTVGKMDISLAEKWGFDTGGKQDSASSEKWTQGDGRKKHDGLHRFWKTGWTSWHALAVLLLAIPLLGKLPRLGDQITFLDVGQGDCICVQLKSGENYLFDCGSTSRSRVGQYCLIPFLKYQGVRRLDAVFLSHPDDDHGNGLEELFALGEENGIRVEQLVLPGIAESLRGEAFGKIRAALDGSASADAKKAASADMNTVVTYVQAGDFWETKNARFLCLHPSAGWRDGAGNSCSECFFVELAGGFCMLLTGDVEEAGEKALLDELREYGIGGVTLLKVAHHGSKYTTSEELLREIAPSAAVISCGRRNRYGHPHPETLERLSAVGAKIFRTDEGGAIMVYSKEGKVSVKMFCE